MNETPERTWVLEVDDVETHYPTKDGLLTGLAQVLDRPRGRLSLVVDCGPSKGWLRFLGGAKRNVSPCFAVEWTDRYASLIFLDEAWSEYRAVDTTRPVAPPEEIRKQIAHGELTPHPTAECMEKPRAVDAIHEFLNADTRPHWLSYRYVR